PRHRDGAGQRSGHDAPQRARPPLDVVHRRRAVARAASGGAARLRLRAHPPGRRPRRRRHGHARGAAERRRLAARLVGAGRCDEARAAPDDHDRLPARDGGGGDRVRPDQGRAERDAHLLHGNRGRGQRAAGARRRHRRHPAAEPRRVLGDGRQRRGRRRRHVHRAGVARLGRHVSRVPRSDAGIRRGDDGAADRGPLTRRVFLLALLVALVAAAPAAAFTPTDPLSAKQWYLADDHAFDAWPTPPTYLQPVKVAVVDSGVDCSLPDFAGRIVASRSFVGGDPCTDTEGHGTFVAGIIAANLDNEGIVGIAYTAQLLVAKVVRGDGSIPLQAEADAIRWATDSGARVINLSLGGVRDPAMPTRDTYSALEASAVQY